MARPQIIRGEDGQPLFAVLPWQDYVRLDPDAALAALGDEPPPPPPDVFPEEVLARLRRGDNPVLVYREHYGATQAELAAAIDAAEEMVALIETDLDEAPDELLALIAQVFMVDLDLLVGRDRVLPETLFAADLRLVTVGQAIDWAQAERDRRSDEEGEPLPGRETEFARFHHLQGSLLDEPIDEVFPGLRAVVAAVNDGRIKPSPSPSR